MNDKINKPRRVGIVDIDDKSWERLTTIGEVCPIRLYTGNAVYSQLVRISIALQDILSVRSATAKIIAKGVEQRVFGLVASLLGIDGKEKKNERRKARDDR
jgi:hypothetical protein